MDVECSQHTWATVCRLYQIKLYKCETHKLVGCQTDYDKMTMCLTTSC